MSDRLMIINKMPLNSSNIGPGVTAKMINELPQKIFRISKETAYYVLYNRSFISVPPNQGATQWILDTNWITLLERR